MLGLLGDLYWNVISRILLRGQLRLASHNRREGTISTLTSRLVSRSAPVAVNIVVLQQSLCGPSGAFKEAPKRCTSMEIGSQYCAALNASVTL